MEGNGGDLLLRRGEREGRERGGDGLKGTVSPPTPKNQTSPMHTRTEYTELS